MLPEHTTSYSLVEYWYTCLCTIPCPRPYILYLVKNLKIEDGKIFAGSNINGQDKNSCVKYIPRIPGRRGIAHFGQILYYRVLVSFLACGVCVCVGGGGGRGHTGAIPLPGTPLDRKLIHYYNVNGAQQVGKFNNKLGWVVGMVWACTWGARRGGGGGGRGT